VDIKTVSQSHYIFWIETPAYWDLPPWVAAAAKLGRMPTEDEVQVFAVKLALEGVYQPREDA